MTYRPRPGTAGKLDRAPDSTARADSAPRTGRLFIGALATWGLSLPLLLIGVASPASAACAGPTLAVSPATGRPGSSVTVSGRDWRVGCNDTFTQPVGGTPSPRPPEPPDSIALFFMQDGRTVELARITAASDYTFTTEVEIPSSATGGDAAVEATGENGSMATANVTVVVMATSSPPGTGPAVTLPRTGSSGLVLVALTGVLVATSGGFLMLAAKSRAKSQL